MSRKSGKFAQGRSPCRQRAFFSEDFMEVFKNDSRNHQASRKESLDLKGTI